MNFQEFVNQFHAPTCIFSIEKTSDSGYGEIRMAAGNPQYLEPVLHPSLEVAKIMPERAFKEFIPNSLYEVYLPKDIGFEDVLYRSAVQKMPLHTYVHMNHINMWFDIFITPLSYEKDNLCYCAYTAIPTNPSNISLSSSHSGGAMEDVLKTCIKLHSTYEFNKTIAEVIHDIRMICRSEVCTIMTLDTKQKVCNVLATDIEEGSTLKRVTQFENFYEIAYSWLDILGGKDCLIIKNERDMQFIKEFDQPWYQSLYEAGVESLVMFPLQYEHETLGFIWATNFDVNNTMKIKDTLELTTYFVSAQLANYNMLKRLQHLSCTDLLTGIPNRFACSEFSEQLIRENQTFTVVSIDINNFKSINSTMGFDTGNKVLKEISSRWQTIAETGLSGTKDFIARLGGDEFALIIRDYYSKEELLKAIRMYEAVLRNRLTIDGCDFYITASFGYAEYPADAKTTDSLYSYADSAMQEVKRINSSNHILHFIPYFLKAEHTLEIERKLRTALENDAVFFNLQPQYDISHKLRGFEALARMKDENGKFISPGEFIPVSEKVGLVDKVDGAVFRKSAMFLGDVLKKTGADIMLSVNVSVRHLMKNDFLEEVREILSVSGLPANRLEIEITESIMIDSAEKALHCIDEIKKMGIKIAIDDFGTGYSSLSYLNSFPANLLKIDKSFIDKMNTSESSKQYVAAIISIGHIMGFDVISEGVEEEEQLETLRSIGCDFIQGYLWGRPLSKEDAEKLVIESCQ